MVLKQLSQSLITVKRTGSAPSEDASVLDSLNLVMERIKTFKSQMEECKSTNASFVKTKRDPSESIQLNYNELLSRIQGDLERIEMENENIKKRLELIKVWSNLDINSLIESAASLALTTHAPPGWDQKSPIWPYRPPYPTEDLIRSSLLFSSMTKVKQDTVDGANEASTSVSAEHSDQHISTTGKFEIHAEEDEDQEALLRGLDIASL